MSRIEEYVGTLKRIYVPEDMSREEAAKFLLESIGSTETPSEEGYDDYCDMLSDIGYDDFYVHERDGVPTYYKIDRTELDPYDDIMDAVEDGDNISFRLRYYNGGCGFGEALDEALERMNEVERS